MTDHSSDYPDKSSPHVSKSATSEPSSSADVIQLIQAIPDPAVLLSKEQRIVGWNGLLEAFTDQVPEKGDQVGDLFPEIEQGRLPKIATTADGYVETQVQTEAGRRGAEVGFRQIEHSGRDFVLGTLRGFRTGVSSESGGEYRKILETIEDGVFVLNESFIIEHVNSAVCSMTGYKRDELLGESALLLTDDDTINRAAEISEDLLAGDRDVATLTTEIETATGEWLPIETQFSTYQDSNDEYKLVGVVRDISDQRQFEKALATLHQSTQRLLQADQEQDVNKLIVESLHDIEGILGAAIYRFDQSEGVLRAEERFERTSGILGKRSVVDSGETPLWRSFVEDKRVTVDSDAAADAETDAKEYCFCLGAYGALHVTIAESYRHEELVETVDVVSANARAALGRVAYEAALREREEELSKRNTRLTQLEELNSVVRDVSQSIMDADTRTEIEETVCEVLTDSEMLSFVWIGRRDGDQLEPTAWAGEGASYLDSISLELRSEDGVPPAIRTASTGSVTLINSTATDIRSEDWRSAALANSLQSVMSLPLEHGPTSYGVLTVFSAETGAFDETVTSVCEESCDTISRAIAEVNSRHHRANISGTELELLLSVGSGPLRQISDRIDTPLVCNGVVPGKEDKTKLFVRANPTQGKSLDQLAGLNCVSTVRTIRQPQTSESAEKTQTGLVEVTVNEATGLDTLIKQGVQIETLRFRANDNQLDAQVAVPPTVSIRPLMKRLEDEFEDIRLTAKRENDMASQDWPITRANIKQNLTDRQFEVVQTAYFSGYYEYPRETNGKQLGERLGVSQPTASKHLRTAVRNILKTILDGGTHS